MCIYPAPPPYNVWVAEGRVIDAAPNFSIANVTV